MNWMNFAWIAGGLLGSLIVGLIVGRVVAGIKYPNPDKPHIFTPKQSAILLVAWSSSPSSISQSPKTTATRWRVWMA